MTAECLYDDGDCDGKCIDDLCQEMYTLWLFFLSKAGETVYSANHSIACQVGWPIAQALLEGLPEGDQCSDTLIASDFNQDNRINFREFVSVVNYFTRDDEGGKPRQVNCSSCLGMEHYNV